MQRLSLSLAKGAGGVDNGFGDGLAVDYDFLDQARSVERFDELKRSAWNGLFPAGATREVDLVAADGGLTMPLVGSTPVPFTVYSKPLR